MRRRLFLQQSALATAALIAQSTQASTFAIGQAPHVLIIGAGFAGLAAALSLHKAKIPFTIIESRNRIGGRVYSFSPPEANGLVMELGAEWVGESHERIISLADELNLTLENNQFDTRLLYRGQYHDKDKWDYTQPWKTKWDSLMVGYENLTDADKVEIDKYDWWHYLKNNGCSGMDLDLRELLDSTDFGESIRHVSAFAALAEYAESSEKNEMDLKIKGGNGMLASKIAAQIGGANIQLNNKVASINQDANGVTITCTNGKTFKGDKLICTAPTNAVSQIDWQPALPQSTKDAINALQYARINKHPVLFNKRFWKDESFDLITDTPAHYYYHATKNQPGSNGILISYTIGDKAAVVANQSDKWNAQQVLAGLKPGFGNVQKHLKKQWNYYWGNDEYSFGSYAMYGIGQWFNLMPILREPHLNCHFAGEHLADWQGFMEGAINTGEEAALKIIG